MCVELCPLAEGEPADVEELALELEGVGADVVDLLALLLVEVEARPRARREVAPVALQQKRGLFNYDICTERG